MNDMQLLMLGLAGISGVLLGVFFFGGLWWTVQRISTSPPVIWFFLSFQVRVISTIGSFYWVAAGDWQKFLACFLGFVIGKTTVIRLTRPRAAARVPR